MANYSCANAHTWKGVSSLSPRFTPTELDCPVESCGLKALPKLDRSKPLNRVSERKREQVARAGSTFTNPSKGFEASQAQRDKVEGLACVGCEKEEIPGILAIDPAHVWPRSKGGCDSPDCVLPACRLIATGEGCHRLFDQGRLELNERLSDSEAWQPELAHPILVHGVSPVELVRRLTGGAYEFVRVSDLPQVEEEVASS